MFATRRVGGRGSSPRCGVVCTATNDVERRRPTASANTVGIPARGGDKKVMYGRRDGTAMVKETGFRRWGYGPRLPWEGCRVDRLCVMPRSRMLPTKRITRNPSPQLNYEATSGSVRPGLGSEVACLSAGHESLKMVNSCVASLLRAPLVLVLRRLSPALSSLPRPFVFVGRRCGVRRDVRPTFTAGPRLRAGGRRGKLNPA